MIVTDFIKYLEDIRPTKSEIIDSLDEFDEDLVLDILEMFDYRKNKSLVEYNSMLLNCINNTTVREKGLADFCFVSTDEESFAYSDDGHNFFLEGSMIHMEYEGDYRLICTSEEDFLYGMIFCFKANMDFAYRRKSSTLDDSLLDLVAKVPGSNSDFFVQRLKHQYFEW
ncbi:hypothetical protein CAP35_04085 [Chitinophagaceae bacterium IBVUCB1]|nr:hypothetical protein CAP35_04085 [Chitinophagaceae bacterium IBVUCB1]